MKIVMYKLIKPNWVVTIQLHTSRRTDSEPSHCRFKCIRVLPELSSRNNGHCVPMARGGEAN